MQRDLMAHKRGPVFVERRGVPYIEIAVDASSVVSRKATEADKKTHAAAWSAFKAPKAKQ
jgi:hypothetical protein